ncbi:MAG: hypothetical protein EOO77_08090 [Oxalobacteraceae bacterium]|nr:MAG: hypothetical protein EOO77_08090 [Oxalobacteraceae bacterium]
MLNVINQTSMLLDRILATDEERMEARERLRYTVARHGEDANHVLQGKLSDVRRTKSKRSIRLAIATLASGKMA